MYIDYQQIGKNIKQARKRRGFTQEVLAERLEVSVGYVSQVERGITKISLDLVAAVATILECELTQLLTGASVAQNSYLVDDFVDQFRMLSPKQKQFVLKTMTLLLEMDA